MENLFNFFVGFSEETDDLLKASSTVKGSKKYDNMIIKGLASDNTEDQQGEILEPKGYNIAEFLKSGLVNLEHYTARKGDPQYWIGEPMEAEVKGDQFFIKAKLWKDHPLARNFWDTLLVMKSSGSERKAGFSIEGQKLEADPNNKKRITKAKIKHVAVTFSPVNSNSYMDIVKGQQSVDYIDAYTEEEVKGKSYILQFEKDGKVITVNRDYSIDIRPKSTDVEDIRGLSKESLKKKIINLEQWDTIMKAIKNGTIKRDHLPLIIKNLNKNFKFD